MAMLIGLYECTLDAKQRIRVPAGLLAQLSGDDAGKLVITRGIDPCFYLYPMTDFKQEMEKVARIPDYDPADRAYKNMFFSGTSVLEIDTADRILFPKMHLQHAGITKGIVMTCQMDRVVVWSEERYTALFLDQTTEQMQSLAEQVRGKYGI